MQLDAPVISPLVELELHSALTPKVRNRELVEADAGRILSVFQVHLADGYYRLVSIEPREYQVARTWIGSSEHRCGRWTPSTWRQPLQTD